MISCFVAMVILGGLNLQSSASAEPPSGVSGGSNGGHRSVILTRVGDVREPISIRAEQSVVLRLGASGRASALKDQYFNQLGRDVIESLRKRGLSLNGLRRISFLSEAPAGSVPLTTWGWRISV